MSGSPSAISGDAGQELAKVLQRRRQKIGDASASSPLQKHKISPDVHVCGTSAPWIGGSMESTSSSSSTAQVSRLPVPKLQMFQSESSSVPLPSPLPSPALPTPRPLPSGQRLSEQPNQPCSARVPVYSFSARGPAGSSRESTSRSSASAEECRMAMLLKRLADVQTQYEAELATREKVEQEALDRSRELNDLVLSLRSNCEALRKELDDTRADRTLHQQASLSKDVEIASLHGAVESEREQLHAFRLLQAEASLEASKLSNEKHELSLKLHDVQKEVDQRLQQKLNVETALQNTESERLELERRLQASEEERCQLGSELNRQAEIQAEIRELHERLEASEKERALLVQELQECQSENDKSRSTSKNTSSSEDSSALNQSQSQSETYELPPQAKKSDVPDAHEGIACRGDEECFDEPMARLQEMLGVIEKSSFNESKIVREEERLDEPSERLLQAVPDSARFVPDSARFDEPKERLQGIIDVLQNSQCSGPKVVREEDPFAHQLALLQQQLEVLQSPSICPPLNESNHKGDEIREPSSQKGDEIANEQLLTFLLPPKAEAGPLEAEPVPPKARGVPALQIPPAPMMTPNLGVNAVWRTETAGARFIRQKFGNNGKYK